MVHTPDRAARGRMGRGWAMTVVALATLLLGCAPVTTPAGSPDASAAGAACIGGSMQIVAHADDDLVFLSPDLLHELRSEPDRCTRTVFITAGDAGKDRYYWRAREIGLEAAYAKAAGVRNRWESSSFTAGGHRVLVRTLVARRSVSVVFLRLPDGHLDGGGTEKYENQSLTKLLDGRIPSMTAVDRSATYTAGGLGDQLVVLLDASRPDLVRTTDYVHELGDGDHADHHAVAHLARAASRLTHFEHTILSYQGYPSSQRPQNLDGDDLTMKLEIYDLYHEYATPTEPPFRPGFMYRQYVLDRATVKAAPEGAAAPAEPYLTGPGSGD